MRRLFNWDLEDILYLRLLDSHSAAGSRRWDGKLLDPTPKVSSLPQPIQQKLFNLTVLDQQLYRAAQARYGYGPLLMASEVLFLSFLCFCLLAPLSLVRAPRSLSFSLTLF